MDVASQPVSPGLHLVTVFDLPKRRQPTELSRQSPFTELARQTASQSCQGTTIFQICQGTTTSQSCQGNATSQSCPREVSSQASAPSCAGARTPCQKQTQFSSQAAIITEIEDQEAHATGVRTTMKMSTMMTICR